MSTNAFIGYDRILQLLDGFQRQSHQSITGYPPFNIFSENDGGYQIELAVAGFKKEEITVTLDRKNSLLVVEGKKELPQESTEESTRRVIRHGIANRVFNRNFTIADDLHVKSVTLEDGILTIQLEQIIREEDKPVTFKID